MSEDIKDLELLLEKTDEFISNVFDHVRELNTGILSHLYDLKNAINEKIQEKKDEEKTAAIQDPDAGQA